MGAQLALFRPRIRLVTSKQVGPDDFEPETVTGTVVDDMGDLLLVQFDGPRGRGSVRGAELLCDLDDCEVIA